jgi:hypothetical protein
MDKKRFNPSLTSPPCAHGEGRNVVGPEPVFRHSVKEGEHLGDAPVLAVFGDDRRSHGDVPLQRRRERPVRVLEAAALEEHVHERAVDEDVSAHVRLDYDAVHALQSGQPRARAQHRRERELVRPQTIGHASRGTAPPLSLPRLRVRTQISWRSTRRTLLGHSVEHLLCDAELPDLGVEDKQPCGDVFAASEPGGDHARMDPLAKLRLPPVHALLLQQKRVGSRAGETHGRRQVCTGTSIVVPGQCI